MKRVMTDEEFGLAAIALRRAIEDIGGVTRTAEMLGIARQSVSAWTICPPEWVSAMEKLSEQPKEELRPDLYGGEA